jgi:hypothetical protein
VKPPSANIDECAGRREALAIATLAQLLIGRTGADQTEQYDTDDEPDRHIDPECG